jgi:hypothetical protein
VGGGGEVAVEARRKGRLAIQQWKTGGRVAAFRRSSMGFLRIPSRIFVSRFMRIVAPSSVLGRQSPGVWLTDHNMGLWPTGRARCGGGEKLPFRLYSYRKRDRRAGKFRSSVIDMSFFIPRRLPLVVTEKEQPVNSFAPVKPSKVKALLGE